MEWEPIPFEGHRPVIPFLERQLNDSPTLMQRVFDVTFGIYVPLSSFHLNPFIARESRRIMEYIAASRLRGLQTGWRGRNRLTGLEAEDWFVAGFLILLGIESVLLLGWLIWPFWKRIPGSYLGYVFLAVAVAWSLNGALYRFATLFGGLTGDMQFAAIMQEVASHLTALVFCRNGIRAVCIGRSSLHGQPVPANGLRPAAAVHT